MKLSSQTSTLSTYQKGKIILGIIENLRDINKQPVYIRCYEHDDKLLYKIAKKAGIRVTEDHLESGMVDIHEYILITYDNREDILSRRLHNLPPRVHSNYRPLEFKVDDKLKTLTEQFELKNIPGSGPCMTLIGEMFRAMQRIQYRAYNDGDLCWEIGSPSFLSYIYLLSQIDKLNYSGYSYDHETGYHKFAFTDPFLIQNSWDGQISNMIESSLASEVEYIKYQLIDLLSNGKIKDEKNEYDSRSYTRIKNNN